MRVTGGAGYSADAIEVFGDIDSTLLLSTASIVFILLVIIYRSPIFWIIPLLSVLFAEITVRAIGYGLAEAGVVINGQTAGILLVLVFGVGTDYALLLVSRYREELRRHEDRHEAMGSPCDGPGPRSWPGGHQHLRAAGADDRRGERHRRPRAGRGDRGRRRARRDADDPARAPRHLRAPRVLALRPALPARRRQGPRGARLLPPPRRPHRPPPPPVWIGTVVALVVLAMGLFTFDTNLTSSNSFRGEVEAVQGQELLAEHFAAGASAPTDVIVPDPARVPAVTAALRGAEGVSAVAHRAGAAGRAAGGDAGARPLQHRRLRPRPGAAGRAKAAGGPETLVGGPTAIEYDLREASERDLALIPPIVLVVILVIIGLLLRAIVAPLMLVATVILSFLAALGVSAVVFD